MADTKISDLTTLTAPAAGDWVPIVDTDAGATKKIAFSDISADNISYAYTDDATTLNTAITLTGEATYVGGNGGAVTTPVSDYVWSHGITSFASETYQNPVMSIGYNFQTSGKIDAAVNSMGLNFENDYYEASSDAQVSEFYLQHYDRDSTNAVRPLFFQMCNDAVAIGGTAGADTLGIVKNAHIYAGGVEGSNGLNIIGSLAGSNDNSVVLANISKNTLKLNFISGSAPASGFAIGSDTALQHDFWSGGKDVGAFMTFTSVSGQGSMLALGSKQGSTVSFPSYPVLGVDMLNMTGAFPGFVLKSKSGAAASLIQYVKHDNTLLWEMDENGVWDIDGTALTTAAGSGAAAIDNHPGATPAAAKWINIEIDGTAHVLAAWPTASL